METLPATTGQSTNQMGITVSQRSGEMAATAMAAKAKATVEARYVIAYNRPRNILQARSDILSSCNRPEFAKSARYKKPIGGGTIEGFSIRFAEEAIKAMKNILVDSSTIFEDESRRTVYISVTDLESNLTYGKEVTVAKTVERQSLKQGQQAISQRLNSYGKTVYLVEATEDDIANKIASAESKIIRNCGLRLVPSDILEEAEDAILNTIKKGGGDKDADLKNIVDSFATLNISVKELEKYLKHSVSTISPKEIQDLRAIYATVRDKEAAWNDYLEVEEEAKKKPEPPAGKPAESTPAPKTAKTKPATTPANVTPLPAQMANPTAPVKPAQPPQDELPMGQSDPATEQQEEQQEQPATESAAAPEPAAAGSAREQLAAKLANVPFEKFKAWAQPLGHIQQIEIAQSNSYATLTEETARKLLDHPKAIRNVTLLHGAKPV